MCDYFKYIPHSDTGLMILLSRRALLMRRLITSLQCFCSRSALLWVPARIHSCKWAPLPCLTLHKHEHREGKKKYIWTPSHCFSMAGNKCVSAYNKQKVMMRMRTQRRDEWNEPAGPSWRAAACLECDICRRPGARARSSLIRLHYAEGGWPDHERQDVPRSSLPKL